MTSDLSQRTKGVMGLTMSALAPSPSPTLKAPMYERDLQGS